MLNQDELKRYNRHIILPEVGIEGQEKLKQAKVLVIGAGGLGCPVLQYLTAAGVGSIGIVDYDTVDVSNLQRQILYDVYDVGKSKVDCAINKLSKQNPFVHFTAHKIQLSNQNALETLLPYDLVIDGTDNFPTRYLVNDACLLLNKPLVYGSINRFEGQVSVFNLGTETEKQGPSYRCLFPQPPAAEDVPNCSEAGVLGVLPGIVGSLQANEAIKVITGIGNPLSGKLFIINALNMQCYTIEFERDKNLKPFTLEQFNQNDYELFCNGTPANAIKEISVNELNELLRVGKSNLQLLDVREPGEQPYVDILDDLKIPLNKVLENKQLIHPQKKVIVFCKSGARGKLAIQQLQQAGFNNLYNLKGGVMEWLKQNE